MFSFPHFTFPLLLTPLPPGSGLFYLFMCDLWYTFWFMCGKLYLILDCMQTCVIIRNEAEK